MFSDADSLHRGPRNLPDVAGAPSPGEDPLPGYDEQGKPSGRCGGRGEVTFARRIEYQVLMAWTVVNSTSGIFFWRAGGQRIEADRIMPLLFPRGPRPQLNAASERWM